MADRNAQSSDFQNPSVKAKTDGKYRYIFGPVPSRRLGFSLGVDVVPAKVCNLNCVYCEVGRTHPLTVERRPYVPADEVLPELEDALHTIERIDHITFTGSGEPTLNSDLERMILGARSLTDLPIAVLTNGTMLDLPEVRRALAAADIVVPSLDAATEASFRRVNRPHGRLRLDRIIDGLRRFREEFSGQIWLEILFVAGMNDGDEDVERLAALLPQLQPDRVQLNTVVRPPAEADARPVSRARLEQIRQRLGPKAEIIARFRADARQSLRDERDEMVLSLVRRRPATRTDLCAALGLGREEADRIVDDLLRRGRIRRRRHQGKEFFVAGEMNDG